MSAPPRPAGAGWTLRAAGVALVLLAFVPAWVAHSALATIAGDEDSPAGNHVLVAAVAYVIAVGMTELGLRAFERGRAAWGWRLAAAGLLPAAWLPSAASWPVGAEVALTIVVALAGVACAAAHLRAPPRA
jgi:hypothetical protein